MDELSLHFEFKMSKNVSGMHEGIFGSKVEGYFEFFKLSAKLETFLFSCREMKEVSVICSSLCAIVTVASSRHPTFWWIGLVFGNNFPSADCWRISFSESECQVNFISWCLGFFPQVANNFAKRLVFLRLNFNQILRKTD